MAVANLICRRWTCVIRCVKPIVMYTKVDVQCNKRSTSNYPYSGRHPNFLIKGSPYSITERRVPELIPVLGSQPAGDVSHKPGGRLTLLSASNVCCLVNRGTMGVNSLPKTVTRQRRGCDLNPGPSAPESSTLTTRLPSHP